MIRSQLLQQARSLAVKAASKSGVKQNFICRAIHKSAVAFSTSPEEIPAAAAPSSGKTVDEATLRRIADDILHLDFVEMNQIIKIMQVKNDIPDSEFDIIDGVNNLGNAGGAAAAGGAAPAAAAPEIKDTFTLKLGAVDAKAKIKVIKEVRTITGLGLKEAKELVEKAPVVLKEDVKKEDAENFKKILTEAGATVELV